MRSHSSVCRSGKAFYIRDIISASLEKKMNECCACLEGQCLGWVPVHNAFLRKLLARTTSKAGASSQRPRQAIQMDVPVCEVGVNFEADLARLDTLKFTVRISSPSTLRLA
jgi:hypothetical protein